MYRLCLMVRLCDRFPSPPPLCQIPIELDSESHAMVELRSSNKKTTAHLAMDRGSGMEKE